MDAAFFNNRTHSNASYKYMEHTKDKKCRFITMDEIGATPMILNHTRD